MCRILAHIVQRRAGSSRIQMRPTSRGRGRPSDFLPRCPWMSINSEQQHKLLPETRPRGPALWNNDDAVTGPTIRPCPGAFMVRSLIPRQDYRSLVRNPLVRSISCSCGMRERISRSGDGRWLFIRPLQGVSWRVKQPIKLIKIQHYDERVCVDMFAHKTEING